MKHPNSAPTADSAGNGSSGDGATAGSSGVRVGDGCVKVEKAYSACHAAIMGVGNYKGKRNCGEEMERLFLCVNPAQNQAP